MPPKFIFPLRLPDRFAALIFFFSSLFLLFAIYLFVRSASSRKTLQTLQQQYHQLLDQKGILEGQVAQLQAEHRQKEAFLRMAETELSLGEQQQLAAHLQNAQSKEQQALQKTLAVALELALRKSATSREVEILFKGKEIILRFYDATLFGPGGTSLEPSGKKLLAMVAQSLNRDFPACPIRVEGHSDNSPVSSGLKARFPSNWELSAYRAATVARTLQEAYEVEASRLLSSGQASTAPLESNDTREGRAKNRRIDLVISLQQSPASPETVAPSSP